MALLRFGEWLPDAESLNNPGTQNIKNVLPDSNGYIPFAAPVVYSNALDSKCLGAGSYRGSDGTVFNFAGDAAKLYQLTDATWGDVSDVGGYSTSSEDMWDFACYGTRVMATNFADPVQSFVMGSSSAFGDLAATAPKARYIGIVDEYTVLGNLDDGTLRPARVQWGPLGTPTGTWGTDPATGADYQDLDPADGFIRRIVGGSGYGVVVQERALTRMTPSFDAAVFHFDRVDGEYGTLSPRSVIRVGGIIYYLGSDDVYAFNGQASIPLGAGKVARTFFNDYDPAYRLSVTVTKVPGKPIILWAYASIGSGGVCYKMLALNTMSGRFAPIDLNDGAIAAMVHLYSPFVAGYTLDSLDDFSTDMDSLPYPLDSSYWTGGGVELAGFNTDKKLVYFTGPNLAALMETAETRPTEGGRTMVTRMRPEADTTSATIAIGTRERQGDTVTWSAEASQMTNGSCTPRASGAYIRGRMSIPAGDDWTFAHGIDPEEIKPIGKR